MIEIPTKCPSCGSTLEIVNEQLFCRNKSCEAQTLKKLQHFCKVMKIKGMGEKTLEKLDFETISDIYHFSESYYVNTLGDTVGRKLFREVQKSKNEPLDTALAAFSIPLVGETFAKKLAKVVDSIEQVSAESCVKAGLGAKATDNLMAWLATEEYKSIPLSWQSSREVNNNNSEKLGITVCITGKLQQYKNRNEAAEFLESLGFTCVDSVTKTTNILIDEEGKGSSKSKKAEQLNIPILTIQQLLERYK